MWRILICTGLLISLHLTASSTLSAKLPAFEELPPCNFNIYTERDDLIIGALVLNLNTRQGCTQNLNTTFPVASVGKLFVAAALFNRVARGEDSFDTELQYTPYYYMGNEDACLDSSKIGTLYTLGELGNWMISCSDNAATWMLVDYLGKEAINAYIQNLGIQPIGEVIPYSEVDRLKLSLLDSRWAEVPLELAVRFYREDETANLVPTYFEYTPTYSREQMRAANAAYFSEYNYNTITPRAMAEYLLKLWQDAQNPDTPEGKTAAWLFNTMLLTQRVFSTQYLPGTTYVGSKNGFDIGLRAEVNITLDSLEGTARVPDTISLVFARHRDITQPDVPYKLHNTPVEQLLKAVSPAITHLLYPDYNYEPPFIGFHKNVTHITLHRREALFPCWQNYQMTDSIGTLQSCWRRKGSLTQYDRGEWVGIGVIVRHLNGSDARLTLIYTQPDGIPRSYQLQWFYKNEAAFAWFEQVSIPGIWRLDIYYNLVPLFSEKFWVN